jgi:urease subunit gamma
MIHVKATIKGEKDVPPLTKVFDYDERVFFSSVAMVEEKLQRKMKINANEALLAYCAHVVKSIRAGKKDSSIQRDATRILSADNVMIGVPETLQAIKFEAKLGNRVRTVAIKKPIPTSSYTMEGYMEREIG